MRLHTIEKPGQSGARSGSEDGQDCLDAPPQWRAERIEVMSRSKKSTGLIAFNLISTQVVLIMTISTRLSAASLRERFDRQCGGEYAAQSDCEQDGGDELSHDGTDQRDQSVCRRSRFFIFSRGRSRAITSQNCDPGTQQNARHLARGRVRIGFVADEAWGGRKKDDELVDQSRR
ncbi:MAG: hypothetical protein U0105_11920 [Candidatus Obscuribacterales bacterium]